MTAQMEVRDITTMRDTTQTYPILYVIDMIFF